MFRSFLVLVKCCVVLSVAQTEAEDYPTDFISWKTDKKSSDCGPYEVLKCVGCPPEDSCYDRYQISCPAAFLPCSDECVCKEGFIRKTLDSECIPIKKCGAPCQGYENYTECKECSNATCSSITNPVNCDGEKPKTCTPGCTCWDGYYRENETSPCKHRCFCPELENSTFCEWWRS